MEDKLDLEWTIGYLINQVRRLELALSSKNIGHICTACNDYLIPDEVCPCLLDKEKVYSENEKNFTCITCGEKLTFMPSVAKTCPYCMGYVWEVDFDDTSS